MLEISRKTDRRLVLSLGERNARWTRIILDRDADRVWFERNDRHLPQRTRSVPLSAITSVRTQTLTHGGNATDRLVVATARARLRVTCTEGTAQAAAAELRAFAGLAQTQAHVTRRALPLAAWSRRAVAVGAVLVVAVTAVALLASIGNLLVGAAGKAVNAATSAAGRIGDRATLPACDADASHAAMLELVRDRLGPGATLTDIADEGLRGGERFCRALARRDGTIAKVTYRNYWDGWTAKVRLSSEIVTEKLNAARTAAIAAAAETLLAAGRNAHLTGHPPRQTDPAIDSALATMFGASDLAAEPLAADEIDKALAWLVTADRIGAIYLLAGTGFDDFANVPRSETNLRRLRSNVVSFADEFGRYADFQLIMLSAIANAQLRAATAGARPGDGGIDDVRTRLSQAMTSNFIALVYDGHNDPWRMARLTALGRAAPVAARLLTKEDARAVREQALQTVDYVKDERVRARIREIAAMLGAA
jgi:hypothetical protein